MPVAMPAFSLSRPRTRPVMIGLAADQVCAHAWLSYAPWTICGCLNRLPWPAGCGKSTFMRRMIGVFGGNPSPPEGERTVQARTPVCINHLGLAAFAWST